MSQGLVDRILTIAVTATLTSAAWIVAGSVYLADDDRAGTVSSARKAPDVTKSPQAPLATGGEPVTTARGLDPGGSARLVIPVATVRVGQLHDTFSDTRDGGRLHEALDIMAPAGTPVIAAADGKVEQLFQSDRGGNAIYVRSSDGLTIHYYAHLRDYAPGLAEGQTVRRGEQLGTVGSSGNADADAPHLHFAVLRTTRDAEWWEPATAINPYPLLAGT